MFKLVSALVREGMHIWKVVEVSGSNLLEVKG